MLAAVLAGCGDGGTAAGPDGGADVPAVDAPPAPLLGVLQFHVQHNLDDSACLTRGDCFLQMEDEANEAAWLEEIRGASTATTSRSGSSPCSRAS